MNELPSWPLVAGLVYAALAYAVMWTWSRRLDREEEEARRNGPPAE